MTATYGGYFLLDLSGVSTVDSTFAGKLAKAVDSACDASAYDPDVVRQAIMAVDGSITGLYWKLTEAGSSGAWNSQKTDIRDVTDGTVYCATSK